MNLLKQLIEAQKQADECKRRVETNFHGDLFIEPSTHMPGYLSLHREATGNKVYETTISPDEAAWLHQQLGRILGL